MLNLKTFANTALILACGSWLCFCIVACGEKLVEKEQTHITIASPEASLVGDHALLIDQHPLSAAFISQIVTPKIAQELSGSVHFTLNRSTSNPRKKYCVKKVQV